KTISLHDALPILPIKKFDKYKIKLNIIEKNIHGVDIEPMAVEISRLRAWLSLIVDEQEINNVKPLPNLEFKFVSANSLITLDSEVSTNSYTEMDNKLNTELDHKLKDIRKSYFRAYTDKSKNKDRKSVV